MKIILKNFLLVDEEMEMQGSVLIENGLIKTIQNEADEAGAIIIDGKCLSKTGKPLTLMPAFVDLHAHFRDPGPGATAPQPSELPFPSELIESASLAAARGGFGTLICMANTKPVTDTISRAAAIKMMSDKLGLIDLYPVISLTKGMEGKELSEITTLSKDALLPLMLSEDGKDLADDGLFLAAMKEAKRIGIPISCHCDYGKDENAAVMRAIELGQRVGCHVHIAHVSTKEALNTIAAAKANGKTAANDNGFTLTCEVTPHHLCLTADDAEKLGVKTWGRVNPPLATEEDRQALIGGLNPIELIDAIATDHAPHSKADKENGSPGFSCLETAFASVFTELVRGNKISLKRLSALMSANPARLLGFTNEKRNCTGRILPGYRADLIIADTEAAWVVESENFVSRGKNSPFAGKKLYGKILMTLHKGNIAFSQ